MKRSNKPRRKKPRNNSPRTLTQEETIAGFDRERDRMERQLAERIAAWAKMWERCPNAGCRRNDRCLHEDACLASSGEVTEEGRVWIGEQFRAFWESIDDPALKYDGDKVR